jgi:hypothetical protein
MGAFDDFGVLVGRYRSAFPTLTDDQPNELLLDVNGKLIISGRYLEDDAHVSGDAGLFMLGVRNDADAVLTSADGDYTPFAVDSAGRLKTITDLDVDFDHIYEEDSAHTSGDNGSYILAVRADTRPTNANTDTDGDYASFFVNTNGELYVKDTDVADKLDTVNTNLNNIETDIEAGNTTLGNIETELQTANTNLGNIETDIEAGNTILTDIETNTQALADAVHDEDSAHNSGDKGNFILGVRNDNDVDLTDTDGDYSPFATDSAGRLKTVTSVATEGTEEYGVSDALVNDEDGLITATDAFTDVASIAVGVGETAFVYGWQWAADKNAVGRLIVDDGASVQVYKMSLNSSAMPSYMEHWSKDGRIEIPGSATTNIKLQVCRRDSGAGTTKATGSIHVRKA